MTYEQTLHAAIGRWTERLLAERLLRHPRSPAGGRVAALDADLAADFAATPFCEGGFYGERTKRFGRLLARSRRAALLVQHDLVLGIVERGALALVRHDPAQPHPGDRDPSRRARPAAAPRPGHVARRDRRDRISGQRDVAAHPLHAREWRDPALARKPWPQRSLQTVAEGWEEVPEIRPGSALLFLGSTLHAAGANRSNEVRRGMIVSYCLGWLKPYENQWLAYPPEIARSFPPELAALVGYRQHRPNLGNFEGQCPSVLLQGDPPERLAAIDALRPDQVAAVDDHAAQQQRPIAA